MLSAMADNIPSLLMGKPQSLLPRLPASIPLLFFPIRDKNAVRILVYMSCVTIFLAVRKIYPRRVQDEGRILTVRFE